MKNVYLENDGHVSLTLYNDNQPHVNVKSILGNEDIRVICRIRSSLELMQLLCLSNALDGRFVKKKELVILYLLGARSDREMISGDSVDLQVVADMINYCNFEKVKIDRKSVV